ncbi:hypothetical protein TYRP_007925 [Tyrophagus putrescentiae]|nr:hypothetical protein TYRP_007925 [Tyrophagus putrescentiae]
MILDNLVSGEGLEKLAGTAESDHASLAFTADKFCTQAIRNKEGSKNHYQTLKTLLRTTRIGINDPVRRTFWIDLTLAFNPANNADDFDSQFDNMTTNKLPKFVDPSNARYYALNPKARRHVSTILWNLAQSYPQITFAPLLYPLVSLFLHYHRPPDVYRCIVALLSQRKTKYISQSRTDKSRDAFVLVKLTNKFGFFSRGKFAPVRDKLKNNLLDAAYADWIQWIFASLPFHHCVRVVDCYLLEGEKFLYRIALELALQFEKHRKKPATLEEMREFCENIAEYVTPSQLISNASKLSRLSRKDIQRHRNKAEKRSDSISMTESPFLGRPDVIRPKDYVFGTRVGPRKFKSSVLTWNQIDRLWEWIPDRIFVLEPIIVFCSDENGNSLSTFFSLCGENEPVIILIKTLKNEVFGAYCSAAWSKRFESIKAGQYFGNGETFLFSLAPNMVKYDWVGKSRDPSELSHSQQLFQAATNNSFTIGDGGSMGLYVGENLAQGETKRCATFENEPLTCSDEIDFDISVVEVIAFC